MSGDWKTTALFIERSRAHGRAFLVGIAIAHHGNRSDDGWTFVSLDLIAHDARLDRKTANLGINDLARLGELEYEPGISRSNLSRYRIRVDVLRSYPDRRRQLATVVGSPTVTMGDSPTVTVVDQGVDRSNSVPQPWANHPPTMDETPTASVNRSDIRSLDQKSDQRRRGIRG